MAKNTIKYSEEDRDVITLHKLIELQNQNVLIETVKSFADKEPEHSFSKIPVNVFEVIEWGFFDAFFTVHLMNTKWFGGDCVVTLPDDYDDMDAETQTSFEENEIPLQIENAAKESPIYKQLTRLKDYVIHGKYKLTADEAESWSLKEYQERLVSGSSYLPIPEQLYDDISSVYDFWNLSEVGSYDSEGYRSIWRRYFALFAKTAWIQFRMDFGINGEYELYQRENIGTHSTEDEAEFERYPEAVFTLGELALLCGDTFESLRKSALKHNAKFKADDQFEYQIRTNSISRGYKSTKYREVYEYFSNSQPVSSQLFLVPFTKARRVLKHKDSYLPTQFITD